MAERKMLLVEKLAIPPDNEIWYTSIDGNIIDVDTDWINNELLHNDYDNIGKLIFKNGINSIENLFIDKTQLTKVWLPNYDIFTTMYAFYGCTNLIRVKNSKQLKTIYENTFYSCINLQQIEIDSDLIGELAFCNCDSLNYVRISKRIERISYKVFKHCTSLESINYGGTIEEWNNIYKNSDWCDNSAIKIIHCLDGDINL